MKIRRAPTILAFGAALASLSGTDSLAGEPRLALYDTGTSSTEGLSAEALEKKEGWASVSQGQARESFKGDAVLVNRLVALVLRKGAPRAEMYARGAEGFKLRAVLVPLAGGAKLTVSSLKTTVHDGGKVAVEAVLAGDKSVVVGLEMSADVPFVKLKPREGNVSLRVETPTRFGVLPDFFSNDMILDARTVPVDKTEVPAENFFMNMLDEGNSIVTVIWDKGGDDIELALEGKGDARVISNIRVLCPKDGSIWVSVLEGKGIWHHVEIAAEQKDAVALQWQIPFEAKWKGNFMRADQTADSWNFEYDPGNRRRGSYNLPCWIERKEKPRASIEPPRTLPGATIQGPFLVYPIERTGKTPMASFTIVDLMRNSLGMGPCEYILDVGGQRVGAKGIFTCSVHDVLPQFFEFGKQKDERAFLEKMLAEVQVFVKAIQDRINAYVDFHDEMLKYLEAQKKAHADQAEFIGRMEELTKAIGTKRANGAPVVAEIVKPLLAAVTADVVGTDYYGAVRQIRDIGGGQDDRVSRCRLAVRNLRRQATVAMALDPKVRETAKEIRDRTHRALRDALTHEMTREGGR